MDPSGARHPQEMGTQTLESMLVCTKTQQEKKPRPQPEQALKCPRCDSTNTKFCYYNNYSLSQPRYFCKSCRRYWTKGGTLRNVPVGGGCRKNRRSSSSTSSKRTQDQPLLTMNHPNPLSALPSLPYDSNDLSLAFARLHNQPTGHLGFDDHGYVLGNPNVLQTSTTPALLDALRSGFLEAPNGFHNLGNYEVGNIGNLVENRVVGPNASEEMAMGYEDVAMKQEVCSSGREGERGAFWGFPWQAAGGDGNMGDLDLGRESWNGIGSWHGLLNSPLM